MGSLNVPSVRSFVALLLPDEVRERLRELQTALRPSAGKATWVQPGNLHLTLKFLGSMPEDRLVAVGRAIAEAAGKASPFRLRCAGAGVFPNARRPRVLWAGTDDGHADLAALAEQVEAALEPLGFAREGRPFAGHITLARLRAPAPELGGAVVAHEGDVYGAFEVTRIHLMKSDLSPQGPTYSVLQEFSLGETK
jgi:2'-5' RNA ligase